MRARGVVFAVTGLAIVIACGGSTASSIPDGDGGSSGSSGGTSGSSGSSGSSGTSGSSGSSGTTDASSGSDGAPSDAGPDVLTCAECKPDFCGCGTCTNDQVVCTKTPKQCPLGCASGCDLSKYTCACAADRCVRTSPAPPTVIPCYATPDCPPGFCCQARSGLFQGACVLGTSCN